MTNNEAAKWIQLYIDLAKFDPTTGEAAYLNDNDKKTIEAMEMAIAALEKEAWKEEHPVSPLQPCKQDDLIRRAAAQTETHEKRTETHSCDYIERQAAIDAMNTWDWQELYLPIHFKQLLEELPSAEPIRKKGNWIIHDESANAYECSCCGLAWCLFEGEPKDNNMNYCPKCGADMRDAERVENERSDRQTGGD